ncbi:MAG: hypothetical protein SOU94_06625 [Acidaminococcus sp.]|uniref:Uncharacterized protein n=1 Tax=Acidaminococcus intestini TaxID=187327 RepID=A0A943I282_9FIRM|nr:hypothetical protein [Acidaminococcus sp.]MBS5519589.1 hypothetical protein [Acidaminococcus intestini]MDY2739487.1 hypothetical protein [Acidaminococcus sp.]
MTLNVIQTPRLPFGVDAVSILNADDSVTILVAEWLSPLKMHKAVVHEIVHILRADFWSNKDATQLEKEARLETSVPID